jgi:putative 4-mercaptohistidine N1-methyltranferase
LPNTETAIGLGANINLEQYASSTPVDANRFGALYDIVGNVWQWTETPIYPFDGFNVHPLYDDFTTPTFDNKHNLFKGGSWISTGNEANLHSRYAFRRHFFQHAGFRYIASDAPVTTHYNPYETQADVVQACEAHYGQAAFALPNDALALAEIVKSAQAQGGKLLEIGCSVGRTCLSLASHFEQVMGLDRSANFIRVANQMQTEGRIRYRLSVEGDIPDFIERRLLDVDLTQLGHVQFLQQDANNLKPIFTGYDVIILNQTLEALAKPAAFLTQIHERLTVGGLLVISSSYPSEARAENQDRLGGFKRNGENVTSLETITELLSVHFTAEGSAIDLPLLLRDDARHYKVRVNQVTLWRKK